MSRQENAISIIEAKMLEYEVFYARVDHWPSTGWFEKIATRVFEIVKNALSGLIIIRHYKQKYFSYIKKYFIINDMFANELKHV